MTITFGELLRRHRSASAFSQEALAERAGLSVDAVRALERGRRGTPRADTIARLVEALNLGADERRALVAAAHAPSGPQSSAETAADALPSEPTRFRLDQQLAVGGFLGALPSSLLIARAGELSGLLVLLDTVAAGEGRAVLLGGEAGVGKTRLAQEVARHAHQRGFLIAAGRCFEAEESVPYAPFLNVFDGIYEAIPAGLQREAAESWPYLGVLLPNRLRAPPGTGASDEQQRVLFAAASFLDSVAAHVPVTLLFDDLHWADSASLRLLLHLTTHSRSSPVLMVGTYRDMAVDRQHGLHDVLRELSRQGLLERLLLQRLDRAGTVELLNALLGADTFADDLVDLVHSRTEGNPFFIEQVIRALTERGDLHREDGRWVQRSSADIEVPETVRLVIEQRVRGLRNSAQEVLHEASILGETFHFDDLAGMTDRTERQIDEALDEAEQIGLIREAGLGAYDFDHGLTRQALYHDLSTRRRRRLHRAAAEAIETLPEPRREPRAAEMAWHFLEGDVPERAIGYALLAGDRAEAVFAHVEAEKHYRVALQLATVAGDTQVRVQASEKLAAPLHRSGRYEEALAALEEAASYYERVGDMVSLAPVMAEIGGVHGNRGTPEAGLKRLAPLLPRLEAVDPSPALIYLYASLGSLLFVLGRRNEHLETAQRSSQVAERLGHTRALAVAKAQLGLALLSLRRRREGRQVLEEAIAQAEAADDLATLGHAINNAAYVAEVQGELTRSLSLYERGLELARQLGNPAQIAFMATAVARNHFLIGDWQRARRVAEEAVTVGRQIGTSWVAPYPLLGLGRILLAAGNEEAEDYLQEGLTLARANADSQACDTAAWLLAELDLACCRPDLARRRLLDAGISEAWDPVKDDTSLPSALTLARTLAATGDTAEAEDVVLKVIDQARQAGETLVLAEALAARGQLVGDADDGFAEAIQLARSAGYRYGEGRVLEAWGRTLSRCRAQECARQRLCEALAIFRSLGARRDIDQTERALVDL